jgi:hypothetical protein
MIVFIEILLLVAQWLALRAIVERHARARIERSQRTCECRHGLDCTQRRALEPPLL